jgi:hypothetical protein
MCSVFWQSHIIPQDRLIDPVTIQGVGYHQMKKFRAKNFFVRKQSVLFKSRNYFVDNFHGRTTKQQNESN